MFGRLKLVYYLMENFKEYKMERIRPFKGRFFPNIL